MTKEIICRSSYQCEVRAASDENGAYISGRPIVYDSRTNMGDYDEIIERGALDGADLTDVKFLVNHDVSKIPLARYQSVEPNSTMQLTVDEKGMPVRVNLDEENNAEARSLKSAVKRRDITGMSFMFKIADEEWENLESEHPTRRIKKISKVYEVSAVTFPAYKDTEIYARSKETLDNARRELLDVRSKGQNSGDNNLELLKLKTQTILLGGQHK